MAQAEKEAGVFNDKIMTEKEAKTAYCVQLFEAHSWDDVQMLQIETGDSLFQIEITTGQTINMAPEQLYLITDQLCATRLPLFFPRRRRVALLKESPLHTRALDAGLLAKRFDLVLTHRQDLIALGAPFVRLDYSANWVQRDPQGCLAAAKNKLVSFIGSVCHTEQAGYGLRKAIAQRLLQCADIDCFGRGIRPIDFKTVGLRAYCFSVAMENTREDYYYTEKLIDCLLCETIPIYWGCPGIGDIFDLRGIITFADEEELMTILGTLSFERYQAMRSYAEKNKKICIDLGLDTYANYLRRGFATIETQLLPVPGKLSGWQVNKAMAGLRLAGETMLSPIARKKVAR